MKVIIDVPEDVYTRLFDNGIETSFEDIEAIETAVRVGTPIPQGHGELKDTDTIRKEMLRHKYSDSFCEEHHIDHSINMEIALAIIDKAPTIIEADKEGEQE